MKEIELRKATAADSAALEELQQDSISRIAAAYYTPQQVAAFLRCTAGTIRTHVDGANLWVLSAAGRLVACAGWHPSGAVEDHVRGAPDPGGIEVRSVYVRSGWTRRGLAARLLDHVEGEAAARGARRASLHAMRGSETFYAARGYAALGAMTFDMGGVPFPGLEMTKALEPAARPQT